jgi:hypothetical protein
VFKVYGEENQQRKHQEEEEDDDDDDDDDEVKMAGVGRATVAISYFHNIELANRAMGRGQESITYRNHLLQGALFLERQISVWVWLVYRTIGRGQMSNICRKESLN